MDKPASQCAAETIGAHEPAPTSLSTPTPAPRHRRRGAVLLLTAVGACLGALSLLPHHPRLVWNFTESVPVGLYSVAQRTPSKGDVVVIAPEGRAGDVLRTFGALPQGHLLLKQLAAAPGDTVCRNNMMISINGAVAAIARPRARDGRVLPAWSGCRGLLPGEVFLLAPHPASFDSRYFGPVEDSQIVGVAHPVFTLPSSQEVM